MKKKKKMIPLIDEENKSYEKQEVCHICKKSFAWIKMVKLIKLMKKLKIIKKLKITVIALGNLEELLIAFAI